MRRTALIIALTTACRVTAAPAFEDCQLAVPGTPLRSEARCTVLTVPENPATPQGRAIELRVAVVPARNPPATSDPIVFLAGGPGQAATQSYPLLARALREARTARDVLLVDQRGTGGSNPLNCPWSEDLLLADPASLDIPALTRKCLAGLDADPRFYTTTQAVNDLERVRRALEYETFNLVGVSYGTRVALEYLRRHPNRVRSVVLDGVVPPRLALGQEHARNAQAALDAVFDACQADSACAGQLQDPGQALSRLRAALTETRWFTMRDPSTGTPLRVPFNDTVLAGAIRLLSYQSETAALIPLLLDDADRNDDFSRLAAQAVMTFSALGESLSRGMELSVICTEDEPLFQPDTGAAGTYMGTLLLDVLARQCALWPRGEMPEDFHAPLRSDVPALLLSGERDPVTPPRYGGEVAGMLNSARHLVAPGQGHGVLSRGCIPRLVSAFLDDPTPQGLDAGCVEALGPAAFFVSFAGPEP